MAYTAQATNANDPLSGDVGYYWQRETCTDKYPALCSIDLTQQGCVAYGFNNISSKKWITNEDSEWIDYEYCENGQRVSSSCDAMVQVFDEDLGCVVKVGRTSI